MTHERPADGLAIDREQRRIEALRNDANEGEASPENKADLYTQRVNDFQARVRSIRKEIDIKRDNKLPEWQDLTERCVMAEQKVFDHLRSILSPEDLAQEMQQFRATLDEVMCSLDQAPIAAAEDPAFMEAQRTFEQLQDRFSKLADEESYWKSQYEDAVRVLSRSAQDYRDQWWQNERSAQTVGRQMEQVERRRQKLQEVRAAMGQVGWELSHRDVVLSRFEADRACAAGDPDRGKRILLKTWERHGMALADMDKKMWAELPGVVKELQAAGQLSALEAELYGSLVQEHFGKEIAEALRSGNVESNGKISSPNPSLPPSLPGMGPALSSMRPAIDAAAPAQESHLQKALDIALQKQTELHHLSDLIDQGRHPRGVLMEEYREPTWGIENRPPQEQGSLQTIVAPSGKIPGVLVPAAVQAAMSRCPAGMKVALRRAPAAIKLGKPQNKSFREAGLGGLLGLEKTGWRIEEHDTLNIDDIVYVSLDAENAKIWCPAGSSGGTFSGKIADIDRQRDELSTDVLRCLDRDPQMASVRGQARGLEEGCVALQTMFGSGIDGNKYQAFVDFSRGQAREMKRALTDASLRTDTVTMREKLMVLQRSNLGLAHGGIERQIAERIRALDGFLAMLENGRLLHVINTMIDKSQWDADTWINWAKKDLPVMIGAIAGAVIAIAAVSALAPVGIPAWALFAAKAAGIAAGGTVGGGMAKEAVFVGQNLLDTEVRSGQATFTDRSRPVAYLAGQQMFDAETGTYRAMELGRDVGSPLVMEFTQNVFVTAATLGASQVAAGTISRFLSNPRVIRALTTRSPTLDRLITRMQRLHASQESLGRIQNSRELLERLATHVPKEIPQEMVEEAVEDSVEKFLNALQASVTQAETGLGLGDLASFFVGTVQGIRFAKPGVLKFSSKPGVDRKQVLSDLAQSFRDHGYLVTALPPGGEGDLRVLRPDGSEQWVMVAETPPLQDLATSARTDPAALQALKHHLKEHEIDDATRATLADTLLGRAVSPDVHRALQTSHEMPGAIDEGNMAKNIPKLGNVYDVIKAELMGQGQSEMAAHTQAMREAKLLLDAGLAGHPPKPSTLKKGDIIQGQRLQAINGTPLPPSREYRVLGPKKDDPTIMLLTTKPSDGSARWPVYEVRTDQINRIPRPPVPPQDLSGGSAAVPSSAPSLSSPQRASSIPSSLPPPPLPPTRRSRAVVPSAPSPLPSPTPAPVPRQRQERMPSANSPYRESPSIAPAIKPATPAASSNMLQTPADIVRVAEAAMQITHVDNAQMAPELVAVLDTIKKQNRAVYVNAHMHNPHSKDNPYAGYRVISNHPGAFCDGKNDSFYVVSDDKLDWTVKSWRWDAAQNNIESVRMSPKKNGQRLLVYYYQSKDYRDTAGNRPDCALAVGIELPANEAQETFARIRQYPEQARAFFIAATHGVEESDYLWRNRMPPYAESDAQRHIVFIDQAAHQTANGTSDQNRQVIQIDYYKKEGEAWIPTNLPPKIESDAREAQRRALDRQRNVEAAAPLLIQIEFRLKSAGKDLPSLLSRCCWLERDPKLCEAILQAMDTPRGFWRNKRVSILSPITRNEDVARLIADYLP